MLQSSHDRAAELHNLAAHAHQGAATAHGKGDHLSAHELSRQAEEHSRKAHKESTEVRKQLEQTSSANQGNSSIGTLESREDLQPRPTAKHEPDFRQQLTRRIMYGDHRFSFLLF